MKPQPFGIVDFFANYALNLKLSLTEPRKALQRLQGGVHKLCLQDLSFLDHLPPLRLHFLWYKSLQKVDFIDHLPPSSCKRSLRTTPKETLTCV